RRLDPAAVHSRRREGHPGDARARIPRGVSDGGFPRNRLRRLVSRRRLERAVVQDGRTPRVQGRDDARTADDPRADHERRGLRPLGLRRRSHGRPERPPRPHRGHGHARRDDDHQSLGPDGRDAHLRTAPDVGDRRPRFVPHGVLPLRRGAGASPDQDRRGRQGRTRRRGARRSLTTATSGADSEPSSLWSTFREAVRGTSADFTKIPIGRAVLLLAVPMVLEMCMESVFAVADVFFVGHLHLTDAISTVGFTESLMTIIYAIAMGLSVGAAATVARRVGEGDQDGASRAAVQSIIMGLSIGALIGAIGIAFAPQLLRIMGAEESVVSTGTTFARVMIGASAGVTLLFIINSVFRGAGDAAIAMRVLWIANAINITLGPCLIFGIGPFPKLGVTGAAIGTSIGRWTGVLIQVYCLTRKDGRIRIRGPHLRLDGPVMRSIVSLSGAATFQSFVGTASYMGLVRIISAFGTAAIAGNTIGIRIFLFALLPSWGI